MTPILHCHLPGLSTHELVRTGAVNALHYIHCDPHHDQQPDLDAHAGWVAANPGRPNMVSLGWLGVEGFNIDQRDDNGVLDGCTQAEFDKGMAGRGFKMTRDLDKCRTAAAFWAKHNIYPSLVHIDHEPSSTPDFRLPLPERARFDALRCAHFKNMLNAAGIFPRLSDLVIEFTQFSNNDRAWATDYNCVRVPFNNVMRKFRSSTELYSKDPTTTVQLAAWLAACDDPSMPFLSAMNPDMLRDQLSLCDQWGATPFIYVDPGFGSSVEWQMTKLEEALHL
jgi:hypothetical protein